MKLVFKLVRAMVGPILLLFERLFAPRQLQRSAEDQQRVDRETSSWALYQFLTCPFCLKVRREIHRLNLKIELRDARNDEWYREELVREGGEYQVPCLKLPDPQARGGYRWMYESDDINAFLRKRFS